MVRKTKAEADVTRSHIIDAARRVFHDCGVSRTTLDAPAAAVECIHAYSLMHDDLPYQ